MLPVWLAGSDDCVYQGNCSDGDSPIAWVIFIIVIVVIVIGSLSSRP